MIEMDNKITRKNEIRSFENVCSSRTNLGLLQIQRNQEACNRGTEYYD